MKWRFADNQSKQTLGADPLLKMVSPVLVKENPVRQVFKCGSLFFKYDKRFFNGLHKEFRHAVRIKAAGIPVVEHLAVSRHYLVTASADNCVELSDFLRDNVPGQDMLDALGRFIVTMKKCCLKHDDLHSGNILYNVVENTFLLVDLCSADIAKTTSERQNRNYAHLVMELRRFLPRKSLFSLLKMCSENQESDKLFDEMLNYDTIKMLNSWKKRQLQILSGYKKFTRQQNGMLISADAPEDISCADKITCDGAKYMLMHHFLELNHIPHRKVWAVDGNTAYLEPDEQSAVSDITEEQFADFSERLVLCGISTVPQDWRIVSDKIKFLNLSSAIEQCELLGS